MPSSLNVHENCMCNEQPRASIFRCLAQKLSSTYDFITALVSPEKPAQGVCIAEHLHDLFIPFGFSFRQ